jgi:hypothetical protein
MCAAGNYLIDRCGADPQRGPVRHARDDAPGPARCGAHDPQKPHAFKFSSLVF